MKLKTFLLAISLLPGTTACATLRPAPIVIQQPIAIPPACRVDPASPLAVPAPELPALPAATAPDYAAVRAQRAEIVGLYAIGVADEERTAREMNAATQAMCAEWARTHGTEGAQ